MICRCSTSGSGESTCAAGGASPASYDEAVAEYLAAIEGRDPTDLYAIVVAGEGVGLIQTYLLADYPEYAALVDAGDEAAGLDVFLAEASLTGSGLGTHVIRTFVSEVVFARAETQACLADPDVRNLASIRAFEKAGFTAVDDLRRSGGRQLHAVMRLDRPRRARTCGQRNSRSRRAL